MIQIVFMTITIKKIEILFKKTRKIILIIMIMIIRNQKSISSTHYFLLNIYINFIKRFINRVINFFDISNKIVKRNFQKKLRKKFQTHSRLFFQKLVRLLSKHI